MKPEQEAWRQLEEHAASQLGTRFADSILRASRGPSEETWRQLEAHAAGQLRPGFADRVLRAIRQVIPRPVPSFKSQFLVVCATAAACSLAVVFVHMRKTRIQEYQNLSSWSQFSAQTQDLGFRP